MKARTKIALWIMAVGVAIFVVAAVGLLSFSPGGMRSNYPAKDNDPKLLACARSAVPIIRAIESYESRTGRLPEELKDLAVEQAQVPSVYYKPGPNYYTLTIKLGWDPSLVFSSQDRSWTFDPGDGSPEKRITLNAEPAGRGDGIPPPHR